MLRNVTAGADIGFVSGIIDQPLTPAERAAGAIGHTIDEWLAYNSDGRRHPLKNNHGVVVGRVLHTYVDHERNLCAGALFDAEHHSVWHDVRDGRVNAFSIGYDAWPTANGVPTNKGFEVSVTNDPVKPFAVVQVRCSNTPMAESTTPATPAPPAAAVPADPEAARLAAMNTMEMAQYAMATQLQLRALTETAARDRENAAKWDAHVAAEKEAERQRQRANLTALKAHGMDLDDAGQTALIDAVATTPAAGKFFESFAALAQQNAALTAEREALTAKAAADAQAAAEADVRAQRAQGIFSAINSHRTQEAKRVSNQWASAPAVELAPAAASSLGLDRLNTSLFAQAQAAAAAAAKAAVVPPAAAPPVPAADVDVFEVPDTPEGRLQLATQSIMHNVPLPVKIRCSKTGQTMRDRFARMMADPNHVSFTKADGGVARLTDAQLELICGDSDYWGPRALEDFRVATGGRDIVVNSGAFNIVTPAWLPADWRSI